MSKPEKYQRDYFRKSGVMVMVPKEFRQHFFAVAKEQANGSLSSWLRPKILRWLAEEKPELKKQIREYLRAEEVMRQAGVQLHPGSMKHFDEEK